MWPTEILMPFLSVFRLSASRYSYYFVNNFEIDHKACLNLVWVHFPLNYTQLYKIILRMYISLKKKLSLTQEVIRHYTWFWYHDVVRLFKTWFNTIHFYLLKLSIYKTIFNKHTKIDYFKANDSKYFLLQLSTEIHMARVKALGGDKVKPHCVKTMWYTHVNIKLTTLYFLYLALVSQNMWHNIVSKLCWGTIEHYTHNLCWQRNHVNIFLKAEKWVTL